jgi:hypothetical protein
MEYAYGNSQKQYFRKIGSASLTVKITLQKLHVSTRYRLSGLTSQFLALYLQVSYLFQAM